MPHSPFLTLFFLLALAKIGRNDVAYRLIQNDTFPSWWLTLHQTLCPPDDPLKQP